MRQGTRAGMLLLGLTGLAAIARADPVIGMKDTFAGLSSAGWSSGSANPHPPAAVAGDGPEGGADDYLSMRANGSGAAGGKLVSFAGPQWLGDYTAGNVTGIRLQARNFGPTDLALHFMFRGAGNIAAYTTASAQISAGSGWTTLFFDLRPAALSGNVAALSSVSEVRFYHDPAPSLFTVPPNVTATLGIDNVTAVSEPGAWLLLCAGLAIIGMRFAVRRT